MVILLKRANILNYLRDIVEGFKTSPSPSTGEGRDEGEVAADFMSLHGNIRFQNFLLLFFILSFSLIYIVVAAASPSPLSSPVEGE